MEKIMLKWLKRIGLGLVGLVLLLVVVFFGFIGLDAAFGNTAQDYTNITYAGDDGVTLNGYLAMPEGEGPHPAVILIHEWWGINEGITILADELAKEGYVVLAPDAYRGNTTSNVPRALWLRLGTPEEQVFADVDASLAHLRSLPEVDTDRVASMGFCFGGGHSLQLGMRQSENLALTIIYYGSLITAPNQLEKLRTASPVLGIFAEEDQQILVADVLEFEANLNTLDIPNEITIYPKVGHGFLNEENYKESETAGGKAWSQTVTFLEENLK
jgi:carboxymethylenebutenolidase